MKQYKLEGNILIFYVKKSPLLVRAIMFLFSFLFFLFPLIGIVVGVLTGQNFHIGYLIVLLVFGLIGFYLLRVSLWNTYGKEKIEFNLPTVNYEANYGWFKDGKKSINAETFNYEIKPIGYEEDKKGALVIKNSKSKIESVVKMPISQIEQLIEILNKGS